MGQRNWKNENHWRNALTFESCYSPYFLIFIDLFHTNSTRGISGKMDARNARHSRVSRGSSGISEKGKGKESGISQKPGIYKYRKGMGKTRGFQKSENGKILGFRKIDTGNFLGIKLGSPARPQEAQNGRKPGFCISKNHSLFSEKRQKNWDFAPEKTGPPVWSGR